MAIIIAIIAAVIVIAGLITYNVRNASAGLEKRETAEKSPLQKRKKTKHNTLLKHGLLSMSQPL